MILSRNSSIADSYYELVKEGRVFSAYFGVTALPIFTNTAQGPLLWNNTGPGGGGTTPRVMAVILGLGAGVTTAPGGVGDLGIAVGTGQSSAPTSTTGVSGTTNMRADLAATKPLCNVYNAGTITAAATGLIITHDVGTAASQAGNILVPLDGLVQVPPGSWCSIAGSAAIASMVANISLIFAEIPY